MLFLNKTKPKNNNSNSKNICKTKGIFFACFRPAVMDGSAEPAGGGCGSWESGAKYVKNSEQEGKVGVDNNNNNNNNSSLFSVSSLDKETVLKKKKKQRPKFSRVVRAVLFETSLAKKIKRNKILQKLHSSKGNRSAKYEKEPKPVKKTSAEIIPQELSKKDDGSSFHTLNSKSLLSEKSPSFRSYSSECKQQQEQEKQENSQENGKGCYSSNIGLYLLLVCLFALVFCGKAYAILCISAWLYYLPRWNTFKSSLLNRANSPENDLKAPENDSKEYRNKIIMEGLLERNRSRGV